MGKLPNLVKCLMPSRGGNATLNIITTKSKDLNQPERIVEERMFYICRKCGKSFESQKV